MPVDQQIREGLVMLDQKLPTPDTFTAYEVIVHEARTRTRRTRLVQLGLAAAATVVVVATGGFGDAELDLVPAPTPAPGPQPVDEPVDDRAEAPSAEPGHPSGVGGWGDLAGRWRSEPVSIPQMVDTLAGSGSGDDLAGMLDRLLPEEFDGSAGVPLLLTFKNGAATLHSDGAVVDGLHDQWYSVDEPGTVTLRPYVAPGGRSRFTVQRAGTTLTLTFLDTSVGAESGIPAEVMLEALYTTVPFERVGD